VPGHKQRARSPPSSSIFHGCQLTGWWCDVLPPHHKLCYKLCYASMHTEHQTADSSLLLIIELHLTARHLIYTTADRSTICLGLGHCPTPSAANCRPCRCQLRFKRLCGIAVAVPNCALLIHIARPLLLAKAKAPCSISSRRSGGRGSVVSCCIYPVYIYQGCCCYKNCVGNCEKQCSTQHDAAAHALHITVCCCLQSSLPSSVARSIVACHQQHTCTALHTP
jgi:hypothetical protein